MDPLRHLLVHGGRERRDPGPRFSTAAYLAEHADVAASGEVALVHYLRHGRAEGRRAIPVDPRGAQRAAHQRPRSDAEPVHLSAPEVTRDGDTLRIRCLLGRAVLLEIAISGPRSIVDRVEPCIEPFLPMALLVAASAGRDLEVDAPADPFHLRSLQLGYLPLIERLFGVAPIAIRAAAPQGHAGPRRSPRPPRGGAEPRPAALLFSAGLDSLYSWMRLRDLGAAPRLLININAGAHDADRACMARRYGRVQRFAAETGAQAVLIDTTFHEILDIPHKHAWMIRNVPAAMSLVGAIGGLWSSTARAFQDLSFETAPRYLGNAGPVVLGTLAWSRMPVVEIGHDATRYEKAVRVIPEPLSERYLEVCTDQPYQASAPPDAPVNCGRCLKCLWMMLALDQHGRLERHASQFPTPSAAGWREAFIAELDAQEVSRENRLLEADPPAVPSWRVTPPAGL
jgi:hypothetical protein